MKRLLSLIILILLPAAGLSQPLTGNEILKKIDENRISDSKIIVSRMIIHGRRGERTVAAKSWQRDTEDSFTEYLSPAREKGIKMLKLGDRLWTYSPSTDRTILISGHLLRQSVMGSDLSYEDMMEDPFLQNVYTAEIIDRDILLERPVWILALKAIKADASYESCRIWVDQERFMPLRENLYAKSGRLLKTIEIHEVMTIQNRWVIKKALYKDVLKEGKGTELIIDTVEFDTPIPDHVFSKASLRK